ncbi:MAG TPA: cytochrome c oxidase subunit II [Pirellulales bacterium]|jgi:cytochrome c oxidase subunit 2|nr:cytochrome c oxidase subunit II [Pirellulales bacterium]
MIDDGFRLLPEQASTHAPDVDLLYYVLVAVFLFVQAIIAFLIVYFAVKYRSGSKAARDAYRPEQAAAVARRRHAMEIAWVVGPLIVFAGIFIWGAKLFFVSYRPPDNTLDVRVVGKQWMWKFQHPSGKREINELHVPLGQPIRLIMISEDVIHSMYVPAFRAKHDVLPGSYSQLWFEANRLGEFHLFCAEYCGTEHSRMIGRVVVQEPNEYQAWLSGGAANEPPAVAGKRLFEDLRCATCHEGGGQSSRCPPLANLYGHPVKLVGGETVEADDDYLRESILHPAKQVVAGFKPIMPAFEGQIGEEGLIQLLAYLKSLSKAEAASPPLAPATRQDDAPQPDEKAKPKP